MIERKDVDRQWMRRVVTTDVVGRINIVTAVFAFSTCVLSYPLSRKLVIHNAIANAVHFATTQVVEQRHHSLTHLYLPGVPLNTNHAGHIAIAVRLVLDSYHERGTHWVWN